MEIFNFQAQISNADLVQSIEQNDVYYKNCAPKISCDPNAVYRTINGSCNNLANPLWGSSNTPYVRLLPAVFADGKSGKLYVG